jgi:hypothetical protein
MGKGRLNGSRDKKERHGETCQCRRCRARSEALERKPPRIRPIDYANFISRNSEDEN